MKPMNNMYTKLMLGKELKLELQKGYDVIRISRWAYGIFFNHSRELDKELYDLLQELFRMEDDPQFEMSSEELSVLADRLISEGEKNELLNPISSIKENALDLGDFWLMCPLCQEVWQNRTLYSMVRCPKCQNKLHNPHFKQ
jgi:hypothetical protein